MDGFTIATLRNKYLLLHLDRLTRRIDSLETDTGKLTTTDSRRLEALRKAREECRQYDLLLRDAADRQFLPDLDAGVVRNYTELSKVLAAIK